jgi:hypothetical protein
MIKDGDKEIRDFNKYYIKLGFHPALRGEFVRAQELVSIYLMLISRRHIDGRMPTTSNECGVYIFSDMEL